MSGTFLVVFLSQFFVPPWLAFINLIWLSMLLECTIRVYVQYYVESKLSIQLLFVYIYNIHRGHIHSKDYTSAKTSARCITQLAKMSINSKIVELTADLFRTNIKYIIRRRNRIPGTVNTTDMIRYIILLIVVQSTNKTYNAAWKEVVF